jgi:arylsulfatase A-like enzyme
MKKTIVAIVADHGEAFLEHGTEGHAANLYTEVTQVPFILTLPFRLEKPLVIDTPVENVDVVPTLLDLVGLPPLPEADGTSLVPLIEAAARGEAPAQLAGREERFSFLDRNWGRPYLDPKPYVMVERDGYRLHIHEGTDGKPGSVELFDVRKDWGEKTNLARSDPEQLVQMRGDINQFLSTPEPSWGGPGWVEIDNMEAQQLRALGYAIDLHAPPEEQKVGLPQQLRNFSRALAPKEQ